MNWANGRAAIKGSLQGFQAKPRYPVRCKVMFANLQVLRSRVLLAAGLIAVTSLSFCHSANAQTTAANEWTWMGGSVGNGNIPGVYGTLGTLATGNVPGSRNNAASWTGNSGHFWLFGGSGSDASSNEGYLNDLWEFNPSLGTYGEWAWMGGSSIMSSGGYGYGQPGVYGPQGTPSAANAPGGRESAATWTDSSGNLWLFGGYGLDANGISDQLNDLWKFNPSLGAHGEWAWMGGTSALCCDSDGYPNSGTNSGLGAFASGNIPGGRNGASSWIDLSGNLWLFGGYGFDASGNEGYLNDLWEFNPSLGAYGEWAWIGGSSSISCYGCGQSGIYGSQGTPASGNIPGGRYAAATWIDGSGNFWLFGGYGVDASGHESTLNDLWEFNPTANEWAWMSGASSVSCGLTGIYPHQTVVCGVLGWTGTLGSPGSGGGPGSRNSVAKWTDGAGNFWLFGGYGYGERSSGLSYIGYIQDIWEYSPSTNEWAWMGGNVWVPGSGSGWNGEDGDLGVPNSGNIPGSRQETVSWTDNNGNFWLFGGDGEPGNVLEYSAGNLNDLWVYQPPITRPAITVTPSSTSFLATQPLTVTVSVSGESGGTTPTGSVTLTGGGYTSAATALASGSATIDVPSNSLAGGVDTLTVTYTPDTTSSAIYSSASGTASVTVDQPAALTSPTPGSALTGSSATFNWSAGNGVAKYEFLLGTTGPGSDNLDYLASYTALSSGLVSNIPINGMTVYARLYSLIGGVWQHTDYTYTELGPASLISPTPGSTLAGSSATFGWTTGGGVTKYEFLLGTTGPGSDNLDYLASYTALSSGLVSDIPTNGMTLYARLYSLIGGVWQYTDYTYTEAGTPVPAALTSPAPGSTLTGSTATFGWTAGGGVTKYEFLLGTTGPGSDNLDYLASATALSSGLVSNILTYGVTVYARLYSLINGVWQYTDYTYTESGAPVPAALTSPAPGSTLTGSSATFTWTAGGGVTKYEFLLGTTGPGSDNLDYLASATALSSGLVSNIPTNGGTVYARLYSLIGGVWQHTDYTYTEQ